MKRSGRKKSRTGVYHIMLSKINRQTIFQDGKDTLVFLETIEELSRK